MTNAAEVLELIGDAPRAPDTRESAVADRETRTDETTRIADALSARSWREASDVARRAGVSVAEAEGMLGLLSLEGRAERGASGWRSAKP